MRRATAVNSIAERHRLRLNPLSLIVGIVEREVMQNPGVANEQRQRALLGPVALDGPILDLRKYCAAGVIVQARAAIIARNVQDRGDRARRVGVSTVPSRCGKSEGVMIFSTRRKSLSGTSAGMRIAVLVGTS